MEAADEAEAKAKAMAMAGSPTTELKPQWDLVSVEDEKVVVTQVYEDYYYAHCRKAWTAETPTCKCPVCDEIITPFHKE